MLPKRNWIKILKKSADQPGYALSALKKRSKSYLTYHLYDGYSAYPETISLFLTFKCNLRCFMCGQWGDEGSFKEFSSDVLRSQLSVDEMKAIVDDVSSFKPNFTLFGGEPMIYKGWIEVVDYIKSRGMRCNIVTNGTYLEKYAEDIVRVGLDEIILSLDGVGEVHDKSRGVDGFYEKLYNGVLAINKLKKEEKKSAPIINVNCTISEVNYQSLEEVAKVGGELDIATVNFHHMLFFNRDTYDKHNVFFEERFGHRCHDWSGFVREDQPDMDVECLLEKMDYIKKNRWGAYVTFFPNFTADEIRQWYQEKEFKSTSYKNRCVSLWMTAYIFPDGEVRPYHSMDFSPGNVRQEPFSKIWNNEKYKDYRKLVKEIKTFPVCHKGCTELYRY